MAKEFLSQRGVDCAEVDVTKDRSALLELERISGTRSVPVITACEQVIVGFDRQRLEQMINCLKQRTAVP